MRNGGHRDGCYPASLGRPLDADRASLLDELARAAGVSVNALAVAALHAGVPAAHEDARAALPVTEHT